MRAGRASAGGQGLWGPYFLGNLEKIAWGGFASCTVLVNAQLRVQEAQAPLCSPPTLSLSLTPSLCPVSPSPPVSFSVCLWTLLSCRVNDPRFVCWVTRDNWPRSSHRHDTHLPNPKAESPSWPTADRKLVTICSWAQPNCQPPDSWAKQLPIVLSRWVGVVCCTVRGHLI